MQEASERGAAVRIPPPLVYLAAVIVGVLLHEFVLPLPLAFPLAARIGVSAVSTLLGVLALLGANSHFQRTGQDPKPWKASPEIISTGIYRFTRNPMYVGMALLQIGIGVGLANGWVVVLVPPILLFVYVTAIRHEEAYLESKFGEAYLDYKRSVRRWL